jgi:anti-anti-sigma factor
MDGAMAMVQLSLSRGWDLDIERGPDWLFVRPHRCDGTCDHAGALGDQVWAVLEQNRTHRLVLELDDIDCVTSGLVGQLLRLQKRIHAREGLLRICGLSAANAEVLEQCGLAGQIPQASSREDAVMGSARPKQPR